MTTLTEIFSADVVAAIEQLVDKRVEQRLADMQTEPTESVSPYMTVVEAAAFLRCSRQRVDDLLSQRRLTRHKDGRRTLIVRADLEAYVAAPRRARP